MEPTAVICLYDFFVWRSKGIPFFQGLWLAYQSRADFRPHHPMEQVLLFNEHPSQPWVAALAPQKQQKLNLIRNLACLLSVCFHVYKIDCTWFLSKIQIQSLHMCFLAK